MSIKLPSSARLETMAEMLPSLECVADIGTDHAWLLVRLIQMDKINKGIGVEVAKGPYERALANVRGLGLEKRLQIRLGDGLAPLTPGEQQGVIIAGMGGSTMEGILERSPEVTDPLGWLLLQPMGSVASLRRWIQRRGWKLVKEVLMEERGLVYPIMLACPGTMQEMTNLEAEYGPLNLAQPTALLFQVMEEDLQKCQRVLEGLKKARGRVDEVKKADIEAHIGRIKEWIQ